MPRLVELTFLCLITLYSCVACAVGGHTSAASVAMGAVKRALHPWAIRWANPNVRLPGSPGVPMNAGSPSGWSTSTSPNRSPRGAARGVAAVFGWPRGPEKHGSQVFKDRAWRLLRENDESGDEVGSEVKKAAARINREETQRQQALEESHGLRSPPRAKLTYDGGADMSLGGWAVRPLIPFIPPVRLPAPFARPTTHGESESASMPIFGSAMSLTMAPHVAPAGERKRNSEAGESAEVKSFLGFQWGGPPEA